MIKLLFKGVNDHKLKDVNKTLSSRGSTEKRYDIILNLCILYKCVSSRSS